MSPTKKDRYRSERDDAAHLIEQRTNELLAAPSHDRPDLSVWSTALVIELMTMGWRPIEVPRSTWSPHEGKGPATPAQVQGWSRVARRRIENARTNTDEEHT